MRSVRPGCVRPTSRGRVPAGAVAGCHTEDRPRSGPASASTAERPGWGRRRSDPAAPRRRPSPLRRRRRHDAASTTRPPVAPAGRAAATAPTAAAKDPAVAAIAPGMPAAVGPRRRERGSPGRGCGRRGRRREHRPTAAIPAPAGVGTAAAGSGGPRAVSARGAGGPPRSGHDLRDRAGRCHRGWRARRCRWTSHSRPRAAGRCPTRSTVPGDASGPSRYAPSARPRDPSRCGPSDQTSIRRSRLAGQDRVGQGWPGRRSTGCRRRSSRRAPCTAPCP